MVDLRAELIQVAAVAVAFITDLDNNTTRHTALPILDEIVEERVRQELTKESEGDDTPDNDNPESEGGEADGVSDRASDEPAAS